MAQLVGLDREEHRRRDLVAIGRRPFRHRDDQRIGEAGFADELQIDRALHGVAGDESIGEDALHALPQRADGAGATRVIMAGRIVIVLRKIVIDESALMRVANLIEHLREIAVLLLGGGGRVPQHRRTRDRIIFADLEEVRDHLHRLAPARMNLIAGAETREAVEQSAELPLVLGRLHAGVFLGDDLELLLGLVRHTVFGRVFRAIFLEVPIEALQPFMDFLRLDSDGRAIDPQRVCRRIGCETDRHDSSARFYLVTPFRAGVRRGRAWRARASQRAPHGCSSPRRTKSNPDVRYFTARRMP